MGRESCTKQILAALKAFNYQRWLRLSSSQYLQAHSMLAQDFLLLGW
jgi:hypothetical protein